MRWQLDRKAVEMSERLDIQFGKECFAMTDFYWPTTWNDKVCIYFPHKHRLYMAFAGGSWYL